MRFMLAKIIDVMVAIIVLVISIPIGIFVSILTSLLNFSSQEKIIGKMSNDDILRIIDTWCEENASHIKKITENNDQSISIKIMPTNKKAGTIELLIQKDMDGDMFFVDINDASLTFTLDNNPDYEILTPVLLNNILCAYKDGQYNTKKWSHDGKLIGSMLCMELKDGMRETIMSGNLTFQRMAADENTECFGSIYG